MRCGSSNRVWAGFRFVAAFGAVAFAALPVRAGHEITYYPSFYPQEIRIDLLTPDAAAKEFANPTDPLQVYIGSAPRFSGEAPAYLKSVASFSAFLVVDVDPKSRLAQDREARCRAVARAGGSLAKSEDVVARAYPITPYHADYLHHADRIEKLPRAHGPSLPLKPAKPEIASLLATVSTEADATLDAVAIDDVLRRAGVAFNGWTPPPWTKEGWFQAYHLLRSAVRDAADAKRADEIFDRLTHAEARDLTEQINLERELVTALTRGCERAVIGYRLRREFHHDDFSGGVENVLVDSQLGFSTPMFFRVIKLKDFPWNGWLRTGMETPPRAAWNPVAGFTDPIGRLVWSALGDDAFLPSPFNSTWVASRAEIRDDPSTRPGQSARVPADAIMPARGTGRLSPIGAAEGAGAKLLYRIAASPFADGTEMEPADLFYPYALAFRWGDEANRDKAFDPEIAAATRLIRERLRGVRVASIEETTIQQADLTFVYRSPIVEVYLDEYSTAAQIRALLAPPWSSVPWHVLALMEAAVERGTAAFSRTESERRNLPWLDLIRDPGQVRNLAAIAGEFARTGFVPAALASMVKPEAAKARWQALAAFIDKHKHALVTNGPYRLRNWSAKEIVFDVVRDYTYPVGLGTFDPFAYPPHALITSIRRAGDRVTIAADVEFAVKQQRTRRVMRFPLTREQLRETYPIRPLPRHIVVGEDGRVAAAGAARWEQNGQFTAALPALPAGKHAFFGAIFLDGNTITPEIGRLDLQGH